IQAPGSAPVGSGQALPENGPVASRVRNLYATVMVLVSLVVPASEKVRQLQIDIVSVGRGGRDRAELGSQCTGGLDLRQILSAGGTGQQVLLESDTVRRRQPAAQVLGYQLDQFLTDKLDSVGCGLASRHGCFPSVRCRSSTARTFERARCSSTR